MQFQGTWVNVSETLAYRVVPKCACSTIGQILYHGDHGQFFPGDIHDAKEGVWKWNGNPDPERARITIAQNVSQHRIFTFTCVRNPYARIVSCFLDKICGIQRTGKRYRTQLVPLICEHYDMDIGDSPHGPFDQIKAFRKFLLFVRDTIKFRHPMHPDLHWAPMVNHAATLVHNGGRYDLVFAAEEFNQGMQAVLDRVDLAYHTDLDRLPRFNESEGHGPKRAHPVEDYFDDLAQHIMRDVYTQDFEIFGYDLNPGSAGPIAALDAGQISDRLMR